MNGGMGPDTNKTVIIRGITEELVTGIVDAGDVVPEAEQPAASIAHNTDIKAKTTNIFLIFILIPV